MTSAERAVERAARSSYGRLVAVLAASTRDVALAEDALADAFERALARSNASARASSARATSRVDAASTATSLP